MAIKKISFGGLRLQPTLLPLFVGHICIWVTKGSHTACCCANVSGKGECQPELILHSDPHCLCATLITNSKHYCRHISSTPSKADVAVWTTNRQVSIKTRRRTIKWLWGFGLWLPPLLLRPSSLKLKRLPRWSTLASESLEKCTLMHVG